MGPHSNCTFGLTQFQELLVLQLARVCIQTACVWCAHRLSINRPTKRGKEKSPSDGHCQCKKEMDDHLLACQQIFEKVPHSDSLAKERASFLKVNDINDILFLGTLNCHYCCSIA
jgi:hypothetical protein